MKKTAQIKRYLFPHLTTLLLTTFCLIAPNQAVAADEDYLRTLEGESGATHNSGTDSLIIADSYLDLLSDEAKASAQIHGGEQHDKTYYENQKKMVEMLRVERPSTYKFYTKLTPRNKAQVFEKYNADTASTGDRLSHLQKHIMDIYFKK